MNPEIRFRVPNHVFDLAQETASDLGLSSRKGKTGGASELARGALYVFLGLGLPNGLTELAARDFERVKANRPDQFDTSDPHLVVRVHHRVDPEYRKEKALKDKQQVPARVTTELRFPQGELPHFLIPYVALTEKGVPYANLNLEGSLSPRKHSLGTLISAGEKVTLSELELCLQQIEKKKLEQARTRQEREKKLERGTKILREWALAKGSGLLKARIEGDFDWLELAADEYARAYLRNLGFQDLALLTTTHTLESANLEFRDVQPQREPQLSTIQAFTKFKELEEPGLDLQVVKVTHIHKQTLEGILIALELPIPRKILFLTALKPTT